jgi:hypothetical protein
MIIIIGEDASQVDTVEVEHERPYLGPSHVEDGGGNVAKKKSRQQAVNQWLIR